MRGFKTREISEKLEIDERLIRYWADKRAVRPEVQEAIGRPGTKRKYSLRNAVQLAILNELWKCGVILEESRKILKAIDDSGYFLYYPDPCYLIYQGAEKWHVLATNPTKEYAKFAEKKGKKVKGRKAESLLRRMKDWPSVFAGNMSAVIVAVHEVYKEVIEKIG